MTSPPKIFSFATMMVLAQRRHAARLAAQQPSTEQTPPRELRARRTLQQMSGTKRLLVFMYSA